MQKFEPTWESLQQYKCPDWFRDAKFGIWAHWGPQAVPMDGDWYARGMYEEGNGHYTHHLQNYGHPSTNGYKDIIPLWKAEKWDPDRLMTLYTKAGARYFVSMGVHHDNFDLWNSTHHRWNAVKMGPRRDIVGEWQKAAQRQGLRFGVSEHLGASFTWFQSSHGADKEGPMKGVSYDGADPKYQDLYHQPAQPGDEGWYSSNPAWHREWFSRIKDLVDQYHPDLLYTDGGLPFDAVGRSLVAHPYTSDAMRHGGTVDVVYTCKQESKGMWIQDLERGVMGSIRPEPWQTDTSIGDWFYNKNWRFRPVDWVVYMLVDIVSKNGNLLLNVVQRPDGSLDPEVEDMLGKMAAWIAVNGEGIYGTRPWLVYGEGAVRAKGGGFSEDFAYSARDVRFTTKDSTTLYAFVMGWPETNNLLIRSLAKMPESAAVISNVTLLGHAGAIEWRQSSNGLAVLLPMEKPSEHAVALKITANDVRAFRPDLVVMPTVVVTADVNGTMVLMPSTAELKGDLREQTQDGQPDIGFWDNPQDWAAWHVKVDKPGKFRAVASVATVHDQSAFVVEAAGKTIDCVVKSTGAWNRFAQVEIGTIEFAQAGVHTVKVRPRDAATWKAINLRRIVLE